MADLGDLGAFLKEGSVPNLDWLEVDPAEYRASDTLPKQNLDVVPDLEALWSHEDKPASSYVENKGSVPHTMGDLSQEHGPLRAKPEDILKVARLAMMQSTDLGRFKDALLKRFDRDSVRAASDVVSGVVAERGLLGKLYIEASDFPGCDRGSSQASDFVRKYASEAKFVLAKTNCAGCVHSMRNPVGGQTCSVFHKEIRIQVPYTEALAAEVEQMQRARGKAVLASSGEGPKQRIRLALLADDAVVGGSTPMPKPLDNVARLMKPVEAHEDYVRPVNLTPLREEAKAAVKTALGTGKIGVSDAQAAYRILAAATTAQAIETIRAKALGLRVPEAPSYRGAGTQRVADAVAPEVAEQQLISASSLTKKRDEEARAVIAAEKARPMVELLRREMLKGRGSEELVATLRHAFQSTDLEAARSHLAPMLREAGLYGVVYSTQESFSDCREGADFLATYNPNVRGIVAGAKCGGCVYSKMSRCLMYGKPLVKEAAALYTQEAVDRAALEYRMAGLSVIPVGTDFRTVLASMHESARRQVIANQRGPVARMAQSLGTAHTMNRSDTGDRTSALTRREIVKTARRFLNEGLYGTDLLASLKSRFEVRDIRATATELRPVIAEQGLQGIHYVDPTVYDDYGKGCREAASLHRSRLVPYLKQGSKCGSCVHQSRPGFCSVINKPLVEEPPYVNKTAQQREVLASGKSTEISYEGLMNNGLTMMAEYQLQNGGMEVELDPVAEASVMGVEFGNAGQGVNL